MAKEKTFTFRLQNALATEFLQTLEVTNTASSEALREAIKLYIYKYQKRQTPHELGAALFGKHSSNDRDRSRTRKLKIREKIAEKLKK